MHPDSSKKRSRAERKAAHKNAQVAREPRGQQRAAGLPDRDAILAFLAERSGATGKRDIARHFGLKGAARLALKSLLREIEADGLIDRSRGRFHHAGDLPSVIVAEIGGRDADGDLMAEPVEWDRDTQGPPPKIVLLPARRQDRGEPAPGLGDRVLLKIVTEPGADGTPATARLMKLIAKRARQIIGVFRALPDGSGRFVPADKKANGQELHIRQVDTGGATDGDVISITVTRGGRFLAPTVRVTSRHGSLKSERAVSLIAISAHGIPNAFSREALAEADRAHPAGMSGREDWRTIGLVTIDPADAKDHDDAVQAEPDNDPGNPGGHIVRVAIADVAHYVHAGSALDREARERGNSVYFPDRVVPMLPERLSTDLCSLKPGVDRPALAVRIVLAADGSKRGHSFHRVLMRSAAKLSYEEAQAAIEARGECALAGLILPLWAAYRAAGAARTRREPLDIDVPERKLVLDAKGNVERVIIPQRLDAHRLIEEFMILANVAAAETIEASRRPLIYRVHDEPTPEKINALSETLASIGLKAPKGERLRPALFNRILAAAADTPHAIFVNEVVLRSQAQAEYVAENYGHFGLNLRRYAHFTSPIRRYADLVVHRALIAGCGLGGDGQSRDTTKVELAEIAAAISAAERRAVAAERETIDRLVAHFLLDRVGAEFDGRISGVVGAGLFIRLLETGADGFAPVRSLGDEYFHFSETEKQLTGRQSGASFRIGDPVRVRLLEAAPISGALRFEVLSDPRQAGALRGPALGTRTRPGPRAKHAGKPRKERYERRGR